MILIFLELVELTFVFAARMRAEFVAESKVANPCMCVR
jgi:hypothetical protein